MSFNFAGNSGSGFSFGGGNQPGSGFPFGQATTATNPSTTTSTFTSFGGQSTAAPSTGAGLFSTQGGGGGFSFNQPTSAAQQPTNTGFSFGGNTAKPATGGFAFGGAPAATPAQTAPQSSGFSFGGAAPPAFGAQQTTTAPAAAAGTGGMFSFAKPASTVAIPGTQSAPSFGGLGGGATPSGANKPFGFGAASTTSASTGGGGFSFGAPQTTTVSGSTGGFKLGSAFSTQQAAPQATPQATQAAPTGGLSFGAPKTTGGFTLGGGTIPQPTATQPPSTGFGGGQPATQATSVPKTTAAPAFGFGAGLGARLGSGGAVTSAPSAAPAPAAGGFSLGGKISSSPAGLSSLATTSSAPSTSATTSGFKLGGGFSTATSSSASTAKPISTLTKSFGLGTSSAAATSTTVSTTAATSATASVPTLRYCDLETKVNTWMSELEQQEKMFLTQATHVNAWNKLLIENADKITDLNSEFENVELNQKRLNDELDYIKTQQSELEDLLKPLEESTKQQLTTLSSSVHTHHADIERERTYNLAENIDSQLKNMVQDLKEVVDHINSTSTPADASNPIVQIGKILSAHMDSLQWLDTNSVSLQHKVQDMSKQVDQMKKEQESKFRLAFN